MCCLPAVFPGPCCLPLLRGGVFGVVVLGAVLCSVRAGHTGGGSGPPPARGWTPSACHGRYHKVSLTHNSHLRPLFTLVPHS